MEIAINFNFDCTSISNRINTNISTNEILFAQTNQIQKCHLYKANCRDKHVHRLNILLEEKVFHCQRES